MPTAELPIETVLTGEQVAFVFPGQGSQYVGMGQRLNEISDAARRVFAQADEALGFSLSKLCFDGPADELQDTINAQPAILTVSHAALEALRERWRQVGGTIAPSAVAGHSLGEYSALVSAGSLDFGDAVRLVRERGRLMQEAGRERPGGMAAVIGLSREQLSQVCQLASTDYGIVVVANDNGPSQAVISGELRALERAMELATLYGARKVVRLGISIASHSPLMERAGLQLSEAATRFRFSEPVTPVVANLTGRFVTSVEEISRNVGQQMVRPVQWTGSVYEMVDAGVGTFLEVGPGQVLSGLIKRIKREVKTLSVADFGLPLGSSNAKTPDAGTLLTRK
ncbi:MAG: ACP S-malonyltransferase [Thermomicrobiales bacterium]